MQPPRKSLSTALAAVLAATVVTSGPSAVAEPVEPDTDTVSVTLLTGDRVVLDDAGSVLEVVPGNGREAIDFTTHHVEDHLWVVPSDATRRVATGVLDRRLFDVAGLVEMGYDDDHRDTLPLIVAFAEGRDPAAGVGASRADRVLTSIDAAAVSAKKAGLSETWAALVAEATADGLAAGVERVWLDGLRRASLDVSVPQIGAPAAWAAGHTGEGTTIAVLDTGVDENHPDLAGQERAERNFSSAPTADDNFGHGTHVASIAAGTGAASDGKYTGVAHGAEIIDGKVLDDNGFGQASWIVAGMEWASTAEGAQVVNLSLGGADTPGTDPLEEAVQNLSEQNGTLFVVAAGNSGPRSSTIESPGSAPAALTVGAVDDNDGMAPFSSRGPLPSAAAVKPDITAPGVGIVAARASNGQIGDPVNELYTSLNGTSMATPHVAGAAALLREQRPDLGGAALKSMLVGAAEPAEPAGVYDEGSGRVDSAAVVGQTVRAEPPSVAFGLQRWPHRDDEQVRREVAYVNHGDSEATLSLGLETGAPRDVFTLDRTGLTVPAGARATVTVTADVAATDRFGRYTAVLVATAGERTTRTPMSVYKEQESYDLTLRHTDKGGALTDQYFTTLVDMSDYDIRFPYERDGVVTVRVPAGDYLLQSVVRSGEQPDQRRDLLAYPKLVLDRALTIDLDARAAKPIQVSPPDGDAVPVVGQLWYERTVRNREFRSGVVTFGGAIDLIGSAHLGPRLSLSQLRAQVNTQWTAAGNSVFYGLAWHEYGFVPTGFVRLVRPSDLATVRAQYGRARDRIEGRVGVIPSPHLRPDRGVTRLLDIPLPFERTEYYNADDGQTDWRGSFYASDSATGDFAHRLQGPPKVYTPGQAYTERFHYAVLGPVLPVTYNDRRWVTRGGDVIRVDIPLFGDGDGNWGRSNHQSAATRLYRDGELIGESDAAGCCRFEVPPGAADYRLSTEATRSEMFPVSRRVAASWTFRSDTTSGPRRLPIATIRYFPMLDENNSAPSGQTFAVPVAVQEQASAEIRPPSELTAEVSYDSGATWQQATVIADTWLILNHPGDADTVSLRTTAAQAAGNTVEQTVIDAYRLR